VKDIAASKSTDGAKLVKQIEQRFADLTKDLDQYGSLDSGFSSYDQVDDAQRKELSDAVNALAEPLSKLTHSVLDVPKA
jgi:iron uptake system component EfeO